MSVSSALIVVVFVGMCVRVCVCAHAHAHARFLEHDQRPFTMTGVLVSFFAQARLLLKGFLFLRTSYSQSLSRTSGSGLHLCNAAPQTGNTRVRTSTCEHTHAQSMQAQVRVVGFEYTTDYPQQRTAAKLIFVKRTLNGIFTPRTCTRSILLSNFPLQGGGSRRPCQKACRPPPQGKIDPLFEVCAARLLNVFIFSRWGQSTVASHA